MQTPVHLTREGFDVLVREHQAGLRAYIRALGAQDAWVDDLAQETFLVAYRRIEHFRSGADFGCWLRGVARNLVLNERRKHARRSRLLQDSILDVLMDAESSDAVPLASAGQVIEAMTECVGKLPTRSREILQRRYAGSANAPTLARAFQLSSAAVRQTLVRTRSVVRRCIEGKLGEAWG